MTRLARCTARSLLALSFLGAASGCCGPAFSWDAYQPGSSERSLAAKFETRDADLTTASASHQRKANRLLTAFPGTLVLVAPEGTFDLHGGPWFDYSPFGTAALPVAGGSPVPVLHASMGPTTQPVDTSPVTVRPSTRASTVFVLSGSAPEIHVDTFIAGSEGSTFAVGRFAEARKDTWVVRTLIVPLDTHPFTPVSVTLDDDGDKTNVGGWDFVTVTYEVRDENGTFVTGPAHVSYKWWLSVGDLLTIFPDGGVIHNDYEAAQWVITRARAAKSEKHVP